MSSRVSAGARVPPGGAVGSPRKQHALELFSGLPDRYDRMGAALSFGQDPRWRRALVATVDASRDHCVLDVATGTGLVAEALVRRYGCSVVGLDQSEAMLAGARRRVAGDAALARRLELVQGEAEELPFEDARFDAVTFTYLLRYVDDPAATMRELARVLKPGGRIASLEFGVPRVRVLRAMWRAYTRLGLPAIGRLVSPEWYEVGRFLGPSISGFEQRFPEPALRRLWTDAGIRVLGLRRMSFGAGVVIWGVSEAASGA
jgi:demethylmenaquinone methyltransferase / 2-methoxy-6-polyprenyl-1,4-benzoquinol methylase